MRTCLDELAALTSAAHSGSLAAVCAAHHVDLMVLFGSAALALDPIAADDTSDDARPATPVARTAGDRAPQDIDIAVRRTSGSPRIDQLALLEDLYRLSGSERIDLMLLDAAGPVARQRALTRGRLLFEATPGLLAEAQVAAAMEYLDTAHLRELNLAAMAAR